MQCGLLTEGVYPMTAHSVPHVAFLWCAKLTIEVSSRFGVKWAHPLKSPKETAKNDNFESKHYLLINCEGKVFWQTVPSQEFFAVDLFQSGDLPINCLPPFKWRTSHVPILFRTCLVTSIALYDNCPVWKLEEVKKCKYRCWVWRKTLFWYRKSHLNTPWLRWCNHQTRLLLINLEPQIRLQQVKDRAGQ